MNETRVNLKHLLEDIRDGYSSPLEEVIIVELIANALDSGASCVSFFVNPEQKSLTILDNGKGMKRRELKDYHNIAATAKIRGKGIGFAGIGAKLSLLIASLVVTETKGGYGSRAAATWHLASETRAPWKFIPFSGQVPYSRGTAVTINLNSSKTSLLSEDFIKKVIGRHYYPLLIPDFFQAIYRYVYKRGVEFFVNREKLATPLKSSLFRRIFKVAADKRSKKAAGFGYLAKSDLPSETFGLAIAAYGKIIKSGWEWLGVIPQEFARIEGAVEIPALAEILTTNKTDFLRDANSLKKYYRYRKAIQEAVFPLLEELGEKSKIDERQSQLRPLIKEIERTLGYMVDDFPELVPLFGVRRTKEGAADPALFAASHLLGFIEEEIKEGKKEISEKPKSKEKKPAPPLSKGPALSVGFDEGEENGPLARLIEDKILINKSHPAYLKALKEGFDRYHIVFCAALVLSKFLEIERSPQDFINRFFAAWGRDERKTKRLFKV